MSSLKTYTEKFHSFETPFYFYDIGLLRKTLNLINESIKKRPFEIHYALKANVNRRILKEIQEAGFGADCVSGNEVIRAVESGFEKEKIVFAGVGKSDREIKLGIEYDIYAFNVESIEELFVLDEIAGSMGKRVNFALRINPNVDAGTHHYITTGTRNNKFGITVDELIELLPQIRGLQYVSFLGLHFHIGSQIRDIDRYRELCERINGLQKILIGEGFKLKDINVGGGLGIFYDDPEKELIPDFKTYFDLFNKNLQLEEGQRVHFELGRSVVGQCGSLISRVLYSKPGSEKSFLVLDAGMTELIRPALYQAYHHIEKLTPSDHQKKIYDIVGPICESSDAFVRDLKFPVSQRGDLMAIRSCGAYAEVMSSRYNLREVAPSVFSDEI